jgi:hypothetical protein
MLKHVLEFLAIPRHGWRVRVCAGLVVMSSGIIGTEFIMFGLKSWPAFLYFLSFGGLLIILAVIALIVMIHGYVGINAKNR